MLSASRPLAAGVLSLGVFAAALAFQTKTPIADAPPGPLLAAASPPQFWKGNLHTHSLWSDGDDFPEMIADRYKVHNLEFVAPHFASVEPAYLQELKANLVRAHSRLINIPVDIPEIWHGGGLSDPDAAVREGAIEASQTWIDVAKQFGARSVRCDPGAFNHDDLTLTIDSYRKLSAYGRAKNVTVLIENHGEIGSQHPEALVQVFRAVGGLFIGALPDFGNFPDNETRLRGLPMLFPYARTVCHAKGLNLDANGNETAFDFQKCVQIAKGAAFKGIYSIEYEGGSDAYAGVEAVMNELVRYL